MTTVLAAAALLGLTAYAGHALGARQRERIVEQGLSVSATVVATHGSRWADTSKISYRLDGTTRHAVLYGTWNSTLEVGSRITVFRDPADADRLVTADGYATDANTVWPLFMTLFAGALTLVAVTGRLVATSARDGA
ncbi:DUF3592 domain-containing protein [Catellatospora vulcania]|uniref:DUF3592 domain-containing protein n=1 Tax=Catellatospora vulcania TaxID=1460450 RepID=UPI0012D41DAE|nr:DUF3592 domain-containing protein [Catellatospora vulcania]